MSTQVGYSENVIWISDSESYAAGAGCVDTIDPTEREDFTISNAKDSRESQPLMHIHNLYADENGETHFRDINIEPATDGPVGKVSGRFPATGVVFRTTDGSYNCGWHTAPRKQYVINLDAAVKVTASDGESQVIGPGEILLVEDTSGKGHILRAVDGKFRHSVFVTLD